MNNNKDEYDSIADDVYAQFYMIHHDNDALSIDGVTVVRGVQSYGVENDHLRAWCKKVLDSYDYSLLHKAAKWCTKKTTLSDKYSNNTKGEPDDFSLQDYHDLTKEKRVPREEIVWLKDFSNVAHDKKQQGKMSDWCLAVTVLIFTDESDTDEYKRAVKYCVRKESLVEPSTAAKGVGGI